jgi:hypothetical protein
VTGYGHAGAPDEDQEFPAHPGTVACNQEGWAPGLDAEGERIIGEPLVPDRLAIVLTARAQLEAEDAALRTHGGVTKQGSTRWGESSLTAVQWR